jgi:hypothetical protein
LTVEREIGDFQLSDCVHYDLRPEKCCCVCGEPIAMDDFHAGVEDEFQ